MKISNFGNKRSVDSGHGIIRAMHLDSRRSQFSGEVWSSFGEQPQKNWSEPLS